MAADSDDEDLKKAIALSLQDQSHTSPVLPRSKDTVTETFAHHKPLDLKALHEERMARNANAQKRQRSISPPALNSRKAPKLMESSTSMPSGAMLRTFTTTVKQDQALRKPAAANIANTTMATCNMKSANLSDGLLTPSPSQASQKSDLAYPRGVVKQTWAFGHQRTGKDIKIEEVLEASSLRTAVISAYQWDPEWILSKLRIPPRGGQTKCIFIMQASDEEMKTQMMGETEHMRSYLRLCFPYMKSNPSMYSMHSKLMLLFHSGKLRIAVPTANMLNFDWGETGVMENSVFLIDLPRLPQGEAVRIQDMTFFGQELMHFLKRQGLDQQAMDGMLNFDFAATEGIAFVSTIGGMSYKKDVQRTGWTGLSRAIRHLNLETEKTLHLDFLTSSCGVLNDTYLQRIHDCARGRDLIAEADAKTEKDKASFFTKKPPSKAKKTDILRSTMIDDNTSIRNKVHAYFPTQETVYASTAGTVGSICLDRKTWSAAPFPKDIFRDYVSIRKGLLSHSKILYARGKQQQQSDRAKSSEDVAWVYIGSANISQAAWGETPKWDEGKKEWRVWGKNWECGVLLPVQMAVPDLKAKQTSAEEQEDGEETESEDEGDGNGGDNGGKGVTETEIKPLLPMSVFDEVLPLPCQYPGAEYHGKEPWFFKE